MTDAIQVKGLTKVYSTGKGLPPLRAVDGIDFTVHEGEIFGFLGPNGAGKTSTIRMLTGLSRPTSGKANVLGLDLEKDLPKIKKRIGVVPEVSNFYDELTALENLVFAMQLYGVPRSERKTRAESLLRRFRLSEKQDTLFARLSRGMKRDLTIAAAMAHRPSLVFLDEPTTGLDVISARNLRGMISNLRDEGVTVFLTTHYLEETERLCDRVAIIVKGQIVALDTIDRLKSGLQRKTIVEVTLAGTGDQPEKRRVECNGDLETVLQSILSESGGRRILSVDTLRPSLEDVFVQLTGLSAEVMLSEKGGKGGGNAGG